MEAMLVIALFASNVVALECLYNHKVKTTGMLLIANMLLTVLIAYQFEQMHEIFSIIVCGAILIAIGLGVHIYFKKKKVSRYKELEEKESV